MAKLTVIQGQSADSKSNLGKFGQSLWNRVQAEYGIADVGGLELLYQACTAADRAEELSALIARDGAVVRGVNGPREHPGLRAEMAARAFVVRTLGKLGVTTEPIKPMGRPPSSLHWNGED
jgi:hypothetical protein